MQKRKKEELELDLQMKSFLKYSDLLIIAFAIFNFSIFIDCLLPSSHNTEAYQGKSDKYERTKRSTYKSLIYLQFDDHRIGVESDVYIEHKEFLKTSPKNKKQIYIVSTSPMFDIVRTVEIQNHKMESYPNLSIILFLISISGLILVLINFLMFKKPFDKIKIQILILSAGVGSYLFVFFSLM